jgi:hypothetical protein
MSDKTNYNVLRFMCGMPMLPADCTPEKHKEIMDNFYRIKEKSRIDTQYIINNAIPEEKWRHNTEEQLRRSLILRRMTPELKAKYIKWAKDFDKNHDSYMKASNGELLYPVSYDLSRLAKGYISDISETKRLWNEEDIRTNWTPVPFGITQEEWDFFDDTGIAIEYRTEPEEDCSVM